jgi:hypothetical protein
MKNFIRAKYANWKTDIDGEPVYYDSDEVVFINPAHIISVNKYHEIKGVYRVTTTTHNGAYALLVYCSEFERMFGTDEV